jgi:transcriptional regulator with XRE-family HTH domain
MSDLPPPTPVGDLLRRAREMAVPKLSRPEVAHRAGIDPGTLGNIERGYRHLGNGRTRAVPGDAAVLAKVARVLQIPPERLEAEGGRRDAAERLREILRGAAQEPSAAAPRSPDVTQHEPENDDAWTLFPDDPVKRAVWRAATADEAVDDAGRIDLIRELDRLRREGRSRHVHRAEQTG